MKTVILYIMTILISHPLWAHETQGFQFDPDRFTSPSALPRCEVIENKDLIETIISELVDEGKLNARYIGEGQFCYDEFAVVGSGRYYSPHCFLDPDYDKMWVLKIGSRNEEAFRTREEGFVEAAYKHAEGLCIFPFTFYMN